MKKNYIPVDAAGLGCFASGSPVIYIVEERANPSADYFILPAVMTAALRVVRCCFDDLPSPGDLNGAAIVFVRYIAPQWARLVEKVRPRLHSLALFIDDDVLDITASAGMPWRYRFKLARLAAWRRHWLRRQGAELWVSTPWLQRKYLEWNPRLILPSPAVQPVPGCRLFYHGTASHRAEIAWLRPVVDEVMRRDQRISFEIVGGSDVVRLYSGIPRVSVVHAMRWLSYEAFLSAPGRHIGLVPLLDTPFNRARSYTKFFDITRCGAVGIYSRNSACAEVVRHGMDGLVAELEQNAWIEAIVKLAGDENLRRSLLQNAEARVAELEDRARISYQGLLGMSEPKNNSSA